jgi:hypothetical protein
MVSRQILTKKSPGVYRSFNCDFTCHIFKKRKTKTFCPEKIQNLTGLILVFRYLNPKYFFAYNNIVLFFLQPDNFQRINFY